MYMSIKLIIQVGTYYIYVNIVSCECICTIIYLKDPLKFNVILLFNKPIKLDILGYLEDI